MGTVRIDGIELREAPEAHWTGREQLIGQEESYELCRLALNLPTGGFRPGNGCGDKVSSGVTDSFGASTEAGSNGSDTEPSFFPVLLGEPGMGKTTLAMQLAREVAGCGSTFVLDCHPDILAEDLVVAPVLEADKRIRYQMSPFATAAYRGAPVVLDEASRLQPAAWASIMGAFDDRRSLMSAVAGVMIPVRRGFCAILTMNQDAECFELPAAMRSRLGPYIVMRKISRDAQVAMLQKEITYLDEDAIREGLRYLDEAKGTGGDIAPRDLQQVFRYYERLLRRNVSAADRRQLLLRALELNRAPAASAAVRPTEHVVRSGRG